MTSPWPDWYKARLKKVEDKMKDNYDFEYERNPKLYKQMMGPFKIKKEGLLKKFFDGNKLVIKDIINGLNLIVNLKSGMSLALSQNFGFEKIAEEYNNLGDYQNFSADNKENK